MMPTRSIKLRELNSISRRKSAATLKVTNDAFIETEPDPDVVAVGLKCDGRPVMDYPPQLLEPAFDNELPLTARRYMKLSPGDWVEKTTSAWGGWRLARFRYNEY